MCIPGHVFNEFNSRGVYQRMLEYGVPLSKISLARAMPSHCPDCGRQLSQHEMFPPGRATRHLCESCYQRKLGLGNQWCVVCGTRADIDGLRITL